MTEEEHTSPDWSEQQRGFRENEARSRSRALGMAFTAATPTKRVNVARDGVLVVPENPERRELILKPVTNSAEVFVTFGPEVQGPAMGFALKPGDWLQTSRYAGPVSATFGSGTFAALDVIEV